MKTIKLTLSFIAISLFILTLTSAQDLQTWKGQYYTGTNFNQGTFNFNFTIYDSKNGGNICYSNSTSITTTSIGYWETEQSNINSVCNDLNKDYYLEIKINGNIQGDRQILHNLRFIQKQEDKVQSLNVLQYLNASGANITASHFFGDGSKLTGINTTGTQWNITGSNYLINVSGVLNVNETKLNKTIDNKASSLNVNSSIYSNSTTWWAGVSGWVSGWFVKNGNNLDFNETKLNASIDARIPSTTNSTTNLTNYALKNQSETFVGNITTAQTGFFGFLGSLTNRITTLWVGNINATGNIATSGNVTAARFVGDGSLLTGISGVADGTGGWTNSSTETNTSLNVNIGGDLIVKGTTTITNDGLNSSNGFVSTVGSDTVIIYNATGNSTFTAPIGVTNVRVLVIAGGGAGGSYTGGGGGAGGLLTSASYAVTEGTPVTVTVGAGGAGVVGDRGNSGANSVFGTTTAIGGGGGGHPSTGISGLSGGSGGGGTNTGASGGAGTTGQGFAGGNITSWVNPYGAAGGGGAGAVGQDGQGAAGAGDGGNGVQNDITGVLTYYAGGGGGGANTDSVAGDGGLGGGANGSKTSGTVNNGVANTGGGGGGQSSSPTTAGGAGGSGIVIVRFTTQQAGGNVGIGTASPSTKLHVSDTTANASVFRIQDSSGYCDYNPESSAPTVSCTSDEELKENIVEFNGSEALEELNEYKVKEYTVKASGEKTVGVIAQEVEQNEKLKDTVTESEEGIKMVELPNLWKLVKAIQELFSWNEEQDKAINELKSENDMLKQELCIKDQSYSWCNK